MELHINYVNHNLCHQSKWSQKTDLNIGHIILFESLNDIQQIENCGKLLNCLQRLTEAYKLGTTEPYGHFANDLDLETTQGLQNSFNLIGIEPSIFVQSFERRSHQVNSK